MSAMDWILVSAVALWFVAVVIWSVRRLRRGKPLSCDSCQNCGGNCASCRKQKKKNKL